MIRFDTIGVCSQPFLYRSGSEHEVYVVHRLDVPLPYTCDQINTFLEGRDLKKGRRASFPTLALSRYFQVLDSGCTSYHRCPIMLTREEFFCMD